MAKQSKRVKPQGVTVVTSLQDVDQVLLQIAQLRLQLKRIDADAAEEINKIKEQAHRQAEPIKARIAALESSITVFAEMNKPQLFDKKKSIELNFGIIGYRKSTKIRVKKTTLEKLKALGLQDAIIVKESPNKEVLATYPDDTLKKVDAKRVVDENFWYEVKEEAITENAGRQVI